LKDLVEPSQPIEGKRIDHIVLRVIRGAAELLTEPIPLFRGWDASLVKGAMFHVVDNDRIELEDMAGIEVEEKHHEGVRGDPPTHGIEPDLDGKEKAIFQNIAVEGHHLGVTPTGDLGGEAAEGGGENAPPHTEDGECGFMSEYGKSDGRTVAEKHFFETVERSGTKHHIVVHQNGIIVVVVMSGHFNQPVPSFTPSASFKKFGPFAGLVPRQEERMGRRAPSESAKGRKADGGGLNEVEKGLFHSGVRPSG